MKINLRASLTLICRDRGVTRTNHIISRDGEVTHESDPLLLISFPFLQRFLPSDRLDSYQFCEPAFLAPHGPVIDPAARWEEDQQPDSGPKRLEIEPNLRAKVINVWEFRAQSLTFDSEDKPLTPILVDLRGTIWWQAAVVTSTVSHLQVGDGQVVRLVYSVAFDIVTFIFWDICNKTKGVLWINWEMLTEYLPWVPRLSLILLVLLTSKSSAWLIEWLID